MLLTFVNYAYKKRVKNKFILRLISVTHSHQLLDKEYATSLTSCQLANDSNIYYCVGTAMVHQEEPEPKEGRLILFQLVEGNL